MAEDYAWWGMVMVGHGVRLAFNERGCLVLTVLITEFIRTAEPNECRPTLEFLSSSIRFERGGDLMLA